MAARLFNLLLCALLLGLSRPAAKAITRPENRAGGSPTFLSDFPSQERAKPIGTPSENGSCGYDFASGFHKYLYAEDDPVDGSDPSGNQDTMTELAVEDVGASLDAFPNIVTLPKILAPVEKASILVTTIIRPPFAQDGIKTQHAVFVSSQGRIIPPVLHTVGTTTILWGHKTDPGVASFGQGVDGTYPDVSLYMDADAHSFFLSHTKLDIRYFFEIDLNFSDRKGHLSGFNERFPSYNVLVNGKQVYDFQQQSFWGLSGFNLVHPEVDFQF